MKKYSLVLGITRTLIMQGIKYAEAQGDEKEKEKLIHILVYDLKHPFYKKALENIFTGTGKPFQKLSNDEYSEIVKRIYSEYEELMREYNKEGI